MSNNHISKRKTFFKFLFSRIKNAAPQHSITKYNASINVWKNIKKKQVYREESKLLGWNCSDLIYSHFLSLCNCLWQYMKHHRKFFLKHISDFMIYIHIYHIYIYTYIHIIYTNDTFYKKVSQLSYIFH